jgi:hypothetical protein
LIYARSQPAKEMIGEQKAALMQINGLAITRPERADLSIR